ncbi:MAG: ABC transporter substrate-binding protein [Candidatus Hodarchaeota archaeon]
MEKRTLKITAILAISLFVAAPLFSFPRVTAQTPLFTIYVGAPDNNPARVAWAAIIQDAYDRIGIDARLVLGDWGVWIPRVLFPAPEDLGEDYLDGGWDIFFLGWTWGSSWQDPTSLYDNVSITLYNFQLLNDPHNQDLLSQIRSELDPVARRALLWEWQEYVADLSCVAVIVYPNSTFGYAPDLVGFADQTYNFPQYGDPMFRNPAESEIKIGQNADPLDFNPILSTSYYDQVADAVVYETLFTYMDNDDMFNFDLTPTLAAGDWVVTNGGLNWTVDLRQDVYWPDGYQFNASDAYMSYMAMVQPVVGASLYGQFVAAGLDNSSFHILGPHQFRVTFDSTIGPYAWAGPMLNQVPMFSYAQMGGLTWAQWRTHGTSTGAMWTGTDVNGAPFPVYGPYGLGPYVCRAATSGWDAASQTFIADRRGTANDVGLANGTKIAHHDGPNGIYGSPLQDQWVASTLSSATAAISALQAGTIDIIDYQFQIQTLQDQIQPAWGLTITEMELGHQFLGFNMHHPIIGTGEETPNGIIDPANAPLYAKYVRQALNYLIPRQAIIDTVLEGYGYPGVEVITPLLPDFNTDLDPYNYDPDRAKELLEMAGYVITEIPPPPIALYAAIGIAAVAVVIAIIAIILWRRK